jgi:hypothetical protein
LLHGAGAYRIADTSIFFNLRATTTVEFGKGNKVAPRTNDSKETLRLLTPFDLDKPDGTVTSTSPYFQRKDHVLQALSQQKPIAFSGQALRHHHRHHHHIGFISHSRNLNRYVGWSTALAAGRVGEPGGVVSQMNGRKGSIYAMASEAGFDGHR